jgi:hypothetical protein
MDNNMTKNRYKHEINIVKKYFNTHKRGTINDILNYFKACPVKNGKGITRRRYSIPTKRQVNGILKKLMVIKVDIIRDPESNTTFGVYEMPKTQEKRSEK